MGILNKITKKEKGEADDKKDKTVKTKKVVSKVKKSTVEKMPSHYYDIIVRPHVSEKAFNLSEDNQHIFVVSAKANKSEIKKAVKSLYGVSVLSVNIINVPTKPKRVKGRVGTRSGYRKAIVKLAKGSKIDLIKETK